MQFRVVITSALWAKLITKLAQLLPATIDHVDVTFSTLRPLVRATLLSAFCTIPIGDRTGHGRKIGS